MPILLVFFLVGACAPVSWPAPPLDLGARAATTIMLVALLLPLAAHYALAHWTVTKLAGDLRLRNFVAEKYVKLRRLIGLAHLALCISAIALGWGWVVNERFQPVPFAELLVPLPYVVGVFLAWILHYDAERALHRATLGEDAPFWSRGGYFFDRLRRYLLFVLMLPVLFSAHQTAMRLWPDFGNSQELQWIMLLVMPVIFVLMPLAVKPALGFRTLPPGPQRDRFEATARRLNFRCTDLLLWQTHGTAGNAIILGVVPQARYVVFTDRLLNELDEDELEAVFGHEIGHVRHGHLLYYAVFLVLSIALIFTAVAAAAFIAYEQKKLTQEELQSTWLILTPLAIAVGYLFLVFGLLSRKCERQADLFGARTVAGSRTEGHPQAAGIIAMTRALEKVAFINGMENSYGDPSVSPLKRFRQRIFAWTHGSPADRIEFLHRTLEDETLEARFQRRITIIRWLVLAGLVAGLIGLGYGLGWHRLAAML